MEKTVCDFCGDEIERKDHELSVWKLSLEQEKTDHEGDVSVTDDPYDRTDLCESCAGIVKEHLADISRLQKAKASVRPMN